MFKGLTLKQKLFCENYVENGGNGAQACKDAGYKETEVMAFENLRKPKLVSYINDLTEEISSKLVATAQERQEFWTSVMRGQEELYSMDDGRMGCSQMKDRLKASEYLGKTQMDFIEKKEVSINGAIELLLDEVSGNVLGPSD